MYKYINKYVDEKTKQEIYVLQDTKTGIKLEETKQNVKDALKKNVKILGLKLRSDGGVIEDLNIQKDTSYCIKLLSVRQVYFIFFDN